MPIKTVIPNVYVVCDHDLTHIYDSAAYLVITEEGKYLLIDSGSGYGFTNMINNILEIGVKPNEITYVILTHCHISNSGGSKLLRDYFKIPVAAHEEDAMRLMRADKLCIDIEEVREFTAIPVTLVVRDVEYIFNEVSPKVKVIHTPGHTPGSLSVVIELRGLKVGFVGDLLGPLSRTWNSNEAQWRESLSRVLNESLDVLCTSGGCVVGSSNVDTLLRKVISSKPIWI
ncbi:MAG: hypothetical protein DRO18_01850 [Thermoprotei archaeon]|nr:MAG: hypothetical protein DRO18_01850 [Thermoprotei archaeon]